MTPPPPPPPLPTASPMVKSSAGGGTSVLEEGGRALGMVETLQSIVREEGARGLYRGLLPNFLKVIPAVSIGYVVYEQLKQFFNLKTVK